MLFCLALLLLSILSVPSAALGAGQGDASLSSSLAASTAHQGAVSLAHITFASGNRQSSDQFFWEDVVSRILASQPERFASAGGEKSGVRQRTKKETDMLLWAGNAVYTDISEAGVELVKPRTPREIERQYKLLAHNTYYQRFVEQHVGGGGVAGVWDEHDMGLRHGAEKNYSQARAVREIYVKHILQNRSDIKDQLSRHEGLYFFTSLPSPAGSALADVYKRAVCVVALDVVSLRSRYPDFNEALFTPFSSLDLGHGKAKRVKDLPTADLLGEEQWVWLEEIVQKYLSPKPYDGDTRRVEMEECALTLFASAWQILLNDNKPFAGWDLFPTSRTRLLTLLKNYEASRFLFLSGHAELSEIGGVTANTNDDVDRKRASGILGMHARHFPLTPLTKFSRRLLPHVRSHADRKAASSQRQESASDGPNGLVEVTSSGLTHSVASAPIVGRIASWLIDGDRSSNTLAYRPADAPRKHQETTMDEGGAAASFPLMSRYLLVDRVVKLRRSIGTLQMLTPPAYAKAFASSAGSGKEEEGRDREGFMKDVWEDEDPRLVGRGSGPAAAKQFVDENVRVLVSIHATDAGSTLLTYEATLGQLPSYRRSAVFGEAERGKAHFTDYRETPPFTIYNLPGEYPAVKRFILSHGCAEVPCVHGKYFMIAKMVFILSVVFVVLAAFAASIIAVLLLLEKRSALAEERKLKED